MKCLLLFTIFTAQSKNNLNPMKKLTFIALLGLCSAGLFAQGSGLGLGVVFGEPTGLSAK